MNEMKYYEINEELGYAMVASYNEDFAFKIYGESITDKTNDQVKDSSVIVEISANEALGKYVKALANSDTYMTAQELVCFFNDTQNDILLFDGCLN